MEAHNVSALIMPTEGWTAELAAMAGSPMITIPLGFFDDSVEPKRERSEDQGWSPLYPAPNIPFGMSFVGRRWDEQNLLGYAYAFEQATKVRSEARKRLREDVRGRV
jgi:amidase